jgi:hypothetical protein
MQAPEFEAASIVMLGSFNPAIFQPRWLGAQGLIRQEEAEGAKITLINTEVADFSTEWFQLQVLHERLQLLTQDPRQYAPLRDLASGSLELLSHTPITAMGMNRHFHFLMSSVDQWHAFGHTVAPKTIWDPMMDGAGLRTMVIEGRRKDAEGGVLRIKIEPSAKVQPGVFIEVNEEFTVAEAYRGAHWVSDRLNANWDSLLEYSRNAAESLLSTVNG